MKKQIFWIYSLLIMGVILVFAGSCEKGNDDNNNNGDVPELTTKEVIDVTRTTAISGGNITSDGGEPVTAYGVCYSIHQMPTVEDRKTTEETGADNFISNVNRLAPNTTYYLRAYATNRNGTGYGSSMSFTTQPCGGESCFTDRRDGTLYKTVTIGNQVWMAENLKFLPEVVGPGTGSHTTSHYYVYRYTGTVVADAKATSNYTTYGVLYNWAAAMNGAASSTANPSGVQGVCPSGWHLPSDAEWTQLTDYLGGVNEAGGKLKDIELMKWIPNTGATNETGFTALPGGARYWDGFSNIGDSGNWWSATESSSTIALFRDMNSHNSDVGGHSNSKALGYSVRCVKN